jgi:HEAT repeat protein
MPTDASAILYDVFISYARRDANLGAAPLDSALKRDFRVWRDTRDLPPEQDFTAEIEKAIKAAARLIVCVTPDVEREDSFVRREIAYAQLLKKPLLVARFADVIPPIHVVNHTWIDFFRDWDASLAKLLRWLRGETVDSAAPVGAATPIPAADPYRGYVERLYADVIESLRVSVFSTEAITLRTKESPEDVPRKKPRINPKFLTTVLRDQPAPKPTAPAEFASLHAACASAGCDGRVLLLGEPGAGKTTSLLAFTRDAAANRLSDAAQPLPVFARISGWDSRAQTPLADWLTAGETDLSAADLRKLIGDGSALLLLDGLDELGDRRPVDPEKPEGEHYDPRERFLKLLPPSSKVILSSRLEEYRQIGEQADLSCAVRLERLDDNQMASYLADLPELWAVVQADNDLKEAMRTPLLLALFRVGFEEAPEEARALRDLSPGDLNDKIWDVFIDRRLAFEQAREPEQRFAYSGKELKLRLGIAFVTAIGKNRLNHTHFYSEDVNGVDSSHIIALALRLNLIIVIGVEPINFRRAIYRCLHLRLRDALVFPIALSRLKDLKKLVRIDAIDVLGKLGDTRAVDALIAALQDSDSVVRRHAADALGKLGATHAVEALITTLRDPDSFVRFSAADALGVLGDIRAVEPLINSLNDPNLSFRNHAIDALGTLKDARAVISLINAQIDADQSNCTRAAHALRQLGGVAVKPLIVALRDPYWKIRDRATAALEALGNELLDPLIVTLSDPDAEVRWRAAALLGSRRYIHAVEPLIVTLHDPDAHVREQTVAALGALGDLRAVQPLIAILHDPDAHVREQTVVALGALGDLRAVQPLIAILHDPDAHVREQTAYILGKLRATRAAEQLIAVLDDLNVDVRLSAIDALGDIGDTSAVILLIAALDDPMPIVRYRSIKALGKLHDTRAVEPLITILNDQDGEIRYIAADVLGKLGDARAITPLIIALHDPFWKASHAALLALQMFPNDERARAALEDYYAGKLKPRKNL